MRFVFITFLFVALSTLPEVVSGKMVLKHYQQIEVNSKYDTSVNMAMSRDLTQYKLSMGNQVDRIIGVTDKYLTAKAPESLLSNLLSDILYEEAKLYCVEGLDLAVINFGGIRSSLAKGFIKVSDMYRVMPFENELVILTLSGADLEKLLNRIANSGGEGVSNVQFSIVEGKATSIVIGKQPLDRSKTYRLATMDYLADGSSGMSVLLNAKNRLNTGKKIRDLYIQGIERTTFKGKVIDCKLDGRIQLIK
jgi:2',3'-cyclic-nucleotide 2'-phosphodiesterase (5'-nucleotidase family)